MNLGQVYTKESVADFMVGLLDMCPNAHIVEPCFGHGVFIEALKKHNYTNVTGIEIDSNSFESINRCLYPSYEFLNIDFFSYEPDCIIDAFVLNPPYVRHEEIDDLKILGVTKKNIRKQCSGFSVYPKANLYLYFIARCVNLLREGGQFVAIFPNAWINTPDGQSFYRQLESLGSINNIISVSGFPFVGNPLVDVSIIKFTKSESTQTSYQHLYVGKSHMTLRNSVRPVDFKTNDCIRLSTIATIHRGLTTGYNKAFINVNINHPEFTTEILSTPKNVVGYTTNGAKVDKLLVLTEESIRIQIIGQHIRDLEKTIMNNGKPKSIASAIKAGQKWYLLPKQTCADIIFPYIIRDSIRFICNESEVMVRDNFYTISSNLNPLLLFALLNNYYIYSQLELCGKSYGKGLLKIQKYDVDNLIIPNPRVLNTIIQTKLIEKSRDLIDRANENTLIDITSLLQPFYLVNNIIEQFESQKKRRLAYEL